MTTTARPEASASGLLLPGLDGSNPLAFLAALGVLRTLAQRYHDDTVRMCWTPRGAWHPAFHCSACPTEDQLIEAVLQYNESLRSARADGASAAFDFAGLGDIIGVAPDTFADFTDRALGYTEGNLPLPVRREPLDFIAAYGTTFCLTEKGKVEPTLFSFANGQSGQCLLRSFRTLRDGLDHGTLERSLLHPWTYSDPRPTLRWDPADCRPYAHLATDPGNSRTTPVRTMQGASYLAFLALAMLPSMPAAGGLRTTGFSRRHRAWSWTWPIWTDHLNADCVRTLLALPDLQKDPVDRLRMSHLGVVEVFRSRRFSYQNGVYFSPGTSA